MKKWCENAGPIYNQQCNRAEGHEGLCENKRERWDPKFEATIRLGGIKHDAGKPIYSLLSGLAIREGVKVLTWACSQKDKDGNPRYEPRNWEKGLAYSRLYDACRRHLDGWFYGWEEKDKDSGLHPLAHLLVDVMMMLHFELTNTGTDDRPIK